MKLTPVFIDLETFWSPEHSLTKMNPIVYCTHPETEIISCAVKVGSDYTGVSFGEDEIKKRLRAYDWSDKIVIGHNMSGFDAMILAWRCGVRPARWGCTLAMARPHHAKTTGLSLGKLVAHYKLGAKDQTALINTRGRHLKDFTAPEIEAMRVYNRADTDQCAALFEKLLPLTSKREMRLIDMTIRMLVAPRFRLDIPLLEQALEAERARKKEALHTLATALCGECTRDDEAAAEQVRAMLASSPKFAYFLQTRGVRPPMKISPATGKETYALSKTDEGFIALTEHEDELVALAANTRLGVKSTILESRLETFLAVGAATGGRMPIPINYYGADTTGRDSGGMSLNAQNLPRILPSVPKPSDALRNSLRAPEGYKVVVADLSGIELRVNMFLWQVPYAMELFRADPEKADLYKAMASDVFGIPVDDVAEMQRQAGKAMHLGCGFGLGTPGKFVTIAKQMAQLDVTEDEGAYYIAAYREKHPEIVQGWSTCQEALTYINYGSEAQIDSWGLCHTTPDGIKTPQGMIRYPGLRQERGERGRNEWCYGEGRHKARIYAGKVTENCVQHLAREVVMDNALRIRKELGLNTVLRVHDELVYVVPEAEAERTLDDVQAIMRTPPTWWPDLVVWSEGSIGDTYGEAK